MSVFRLNEDNKTYYRNLITFQENLYSILQNSVARKLPPLKVCKELKNAALLNTEHHKKSIKYQTWPRNDRL